MMETTDFQMGRIERAAINAVRDVMGKDVIQEDMYKGVGKIALHISLARCAAMTIMHDAYAFPYSAIGRRTGMVTNSVMRIVAKTRELRFTDKLYKEIYDRTIEYLI